MKSSFVKAFPLWLAVLVVMLAVVPAARPDVWDKRTEVKFFEPVEFPGGVVVPAGDYVMKLADSPVNRSIVQVLNEEQSRVYATILTIPAQRAKPAEKTIITFHESAGMDPLLIQKWFYPGDTIGREFPQSKQRLRYMASARYSTPSVSARVEESLAPENTGLEQEEPAPEQGESISEQTDGTIETADNRTPTDAEVAQAHSPSATPQAARESALPSEPPPTLKANQNLPATASSAPYLAFGGALFLATGLLLTVIRRVWT